MPRLFTALPLGNGLITVTVSMKATIAGWSSSVARWAHNPEVAGSNPAPATKKRFRSLVGRRRFFNNVEDLGGGRPRGRRLLPPLLKSAGQQHNEGPGQLPGAFASHRNLTVVVVADGYYE
jgi:hypothetical protein